MIINFILMAFHRMNLVSCFLLEFLPSLVVKEDLLE